MMKKILILLFIGLFLLMPSLTINANGLPYSTYTYSSALGRMVWTQDAYIPLSIQTELSGLNLSQPQDLTIDQDDNLYISDYGNKRIIKYSLKDDSVLVIGEGILDEPMGIHVGEDGHLYVADFGLKMGLKFFYDENIGNYV
jgi:hypothetical protein